MSQIKKILHLWVTSSYFVIHYIILITLMDTFDNFFLFSPYCRHFVKRFTVHINTYAQRYCNEAVYLFKVSQNTHCPLYKMETCPYLGHLSGCYLPTDESNQTLAVSLGCPETKREVFFLAWSLPLFPPPSCFIKT